MNLKELFFKALEIKDPWYIKSIDLVNEQLIIEVDFKAGSTFADDDNGNDISKPYKAYDTVMKTWRHLDFLQYHCFIKARVPRVKRDDGKVRLVSPPWSGLMNGFTLLFESFIFKLAKEMPVSRVAKLKGLHDNKIWNMLDLYIFGAKSDEDYSSVDVVGIDETSIAKGHDYISLFVDLQKRKTMFISQGKDNKTIANFSDDLLDHNASASQIKEVSCDMSPAFIKGVKEQLINAKITFDKFHILKIINQAVDQVRRSESATNPILKKTLNKTRYIWLKNDTNLTAKERAKKAELTELSMGSLNLKSMQAMHIRENFQAIYYADNVDEFETLLQKWHSWAIKSGLEPMIKAAKTIKSHWEGIIRWKVSQINNGILEGLNSVLQAAKRKARGYGAKHFMTIAYFLTGKLNFSKVNKFCSTHSF
jgi:transposase